MADILVSYFQKLFTSVGGTQCEEATNSIQKVINADMNHQLLADFTTWEVQKVTNVMAPLKALDLMVCHCCSTNTFEVPLVMMSHNLFCIFLILQLSLNILITLLFPSYQKINPLSMLQILDP